MNADDLSRLAGYLYAAIEAGRATKDDWSTWADRMIEVGVTPDWIIDLSLARSKEQAIGQLEPLGGYDADAAMGHLAIRHLHFQLPLRAFLVEATNLSYDSHDGAFALYERLDRLDEGVPESTIFAELAPLLAPLVDEAERQWKELFPES